MSWQFILFLSTTSLLNLDSITISWQACEQTDEAFVARFHFWIVEGIQNWIECRVEMSWQISEDVKFHR